MPHARRAEGGWAMRWWYRALVAFLAAAMVLCTVGMAYACLSLWNAESGWTGERTGDAFQLTNGTYDICGTLDDGALREMNIRRVDAAESPSP